MSLLSREQCGSQAQASLLGSSWGSSELGSPLLHGSSSWFGGPGDPSLSLELTNEFEGTFVKADAAAESRIAELEGFGSISSSTGNEPLVTIWQFYRPYVTDGKRAENRCAGERHPSSLSVRQGLPPLGVLAQRWAGCPCGLCFLRVSC